MTHNLLMVQAPGFIPSRTQDGINPKSKIPNLKSQI